MPKDFMDKIVEAAVSQLWALLKLWWPHLWPYAMGFAIFVVGGMVLQILMLRSGGHSRLSPGFNRMVGSMFYGIFFMLLLIIAYWIWGSQVIDDIWFLIFGTISFPLTGFFLRAIGFWYC